MILTDQQFESPDRRTMYCKLPGITFVLFKSPSCHFCTEIEPIFQNLAIRDKRLTWAIADVGRYKNIVMMSNNSNTPIKGVPMMILYIDGLPKANYKGPRQAPEIMNFLNDILGKMTSQRKQFIPPVGPQRTTPQNTGPPPRIFETSPQNSLKNIPQDNENTLQIPKNMIPYNEPFKAYQRF